MVVPFVRKPISKLALSTLAVIYLLLLNFLAAHDVRAFFFYGIWPALVTLIFLALISILPSRSSILKTTIALLIFTASTAVFFRYKYNAIITEDIMLSAWQNEASLSLEMLSMNLVIWLLWTAVLPVFLVIFMPVKSCSVTRQIGYSISFCLLLSLGIIGIFHAQSFEMRDAGQIRDPKIANSLSYFSPVDVIYSIHMARKSYNAFLKDYKNLPRLSKTHHYSLASGMEDVFVLVIVGESARGDRFSLNGYTKNTNQKLSTVKNLHSFEAVSSCDTITIRSVKCVFGRFTGDRLEEVTETAFTDVFRSLGFKIEIYSLQGMNDFYSYLGYDKSVSKYAVLRRSELGAKDEALLPFLRDAIDGQQGRKLVILHTLGSHQTYLDRTSEVHRNFTPYCIDADVRACSSELLSNAYDNTIVATDDFIHRSIRMLENRKAVMFYVSDHGESLGENGFYFHGSPPDIAPKEQFHVPMMIWMSPPLLETPLGRKMNSHLAAIDRRARLSHRNFFHSVLGCAGISSSDGGMDGDLNLCGEN